MEEIKFSIIVPVYNTELYLESCIQSVLNQTYSNWELILVDDGSQDNSGSICDKYSIADNRIRTFHKKNEGVFATRQFAYNNIIGNFIVYLDSDDSLKPNSLYIIYKTIKECKCDCVIYGFDRCLNNKVVYYFCEKNKVTYTKHEKKELYTKVFESGYYNSLFSKAIRADIFNDKDYSKYYHVKYGEDLIQSLDVYKYCDTITFIPCRLYNYNINPNSATSNLNNNYYYTFFFVREKLLSFLQEEKILDRNDYAKIRNYYLDKLNYQLMEISTSNLKKTEKYNLYFYIYNCYFYQNFISGNNMKHILCYFFRSKKFNILIFYAKMRKILSTAKHMLNKFFS